MDLVKVKQEPDQEGYPVNLPPVWVAVKLEQGEEEEEGECPPLKKRRDNLGLVDFTALQAWRKVSKPKVRSYIRWNILWKEEIKEGDCAAFKWRDKPWPHSHRVKPSGIRNNRNPLNNKSWLLTQVLTVLDPNIRSEIFEYLNLRPCGDQRTSYCCQHETFYSSYYGCPHCDPEIFKKTEPWEWQWITLSGEPTYKPGFFVYNLDQFLYDPNRFSKDPAHTIVVSKRV